MEHLQEIHRLPRVFGIFPFDSRFRLSIPWLAHAVLVRTVSVLGALVITMGTKGYRATLGPINKKVGPSMPLNMTGAVFFTAYHVLMVLWWIHKRDLTLRLVEGLDRHLKKCRLVLPKCSLRQVHFLLTSSLLLTEIFNSTIHFDRLLGRLIHEFISFLSVSTTIVCIGHFLDLMELLCILFAEDTRKCDLASVIAYDDYLYLSRIVNDLCKPVIFITVVECFLFIVIFLFALLTPPFSLNYADCCIAFCVINATVLIVSIIQPCNKLKYLADKFNEELYRKLAGDRSQRYLVTTSYDNSVEESRIRTIDVKLTSKERLNFHFLAKREVLFTAYGYFPIDNTLISSMISAASTYLVISLQYWTGRESLNLETTLNATELLTNLSLIEAKLEP